MRQIMNEALIIKNVFESDVVSCALDVCIPNFLQFSEQQEVLNSAKGIAEAFGVSLCFDSILSDESRTLERDVIQSWNRNVHLLIDKTWVEQNDELFKMETARSLDRMTESFTTFLLEKKEMYSPNFQSFCTILSDIVYLLFGTEAKLDSLVEYVLRMEPHFGLFCYYLSQIKQINKLDEHKARLAILIAVVFLAEF